MKNLKIYLLEARKTIGVLPFSFELFDSFINDAIIDANYEDSEYWEPMKKCVNEYNPNIWNIFYSWCESILELNISTREFYDKISQIPLDRYNRVVGAGSNGIVLDMGDNVLKIYYSNKIKGYDDKFYKYCLTHKTKSFPKVYKVGKNWVLMEKLLIKTKDTIKLMNLFDSNELIGGKKLWRWVECDPKEIDESIFSADQLWALKWCQTCKEEMEKMNIGIKWPCDFVLNNIGQRKNGEIIFFDV